MVNNTFSTAWKASVKPRKQRNYATNAPLHIKSKFMTAPVAKELIAKVGSSNTRVRTGDKVRVVRGQFSGTIGAVESIDIKASRIYVAKAELVKKDGSKVKYPIHPSKVLILEVADKDKVRFAKPQSAKKTTK